MARNTGEHEHQKRKKGSAFASARKDAAERMAAEEAIAPKGTGGIAEIIATGLGGVGGLIAAGGNPAGIVPGMALGKKVGGLAEKHLFKEEPVDVDTITDIVEIGTGAKGLSEMGGEAGDVEAPEGGEDPKAPKTPKGSAFTRHRTMKTAG